MTNETSNAACNAVTNGVRVPNPDQTRPDQTLSVVLQVVQYQLVRTARAVALAAAVVQADLVLVS